MTTARNWICGCRWMIAVVAACFAVGVFAAGAPAKQVIKSGDAAPDFTLSAVRGGSFTLLSAASRPVLIAFLQTTPDTADTPSRSQVALLQSMDNQYHGRGLRVAIIDATALATSHQPDHNSLINASYDWNLQIPLLEDDSGRVAQMLGVTHAPTTILVKADGTIAKVWDRPIAPGELAVAIETSLGSGPLAPKRSPTQAPK
jgi:peroxiredoxin